MSGKASRLDEEEILRSDPVPARSSCALERVTVVERLRERVLDPLALSVDHARPLAVPALDPAALDLEAEDPLLGVAEDEVDLTVESALARIADHPAGRVVGLPFVRQLIPQHGEHALLSAAFHLVVDERPGIHPRHNAFLQPGTPPRKFDVVFGRRWDAAPSTESVARRNRPALLVRSPPAAARLHVVVGASRLADAHGVVVGSVRELIEQRRFGRQFGRRVGRRLRPASRAAPSRRRGRAHWPS